MSVTRHEIRPGAYYDSVVLMHLQRALLNQPGVLDAGVVMATSANQELLEQNDLLPDEVKVTKPEDLLIVLRAETESDAQEALGKIDELIAARRSVSAGKFRPKSLESAVKLLPDAKYALISVPGRFAAGVAREALDLNLHVFLYSDNVSLEEEIQLKEHAMSKGLLVMGPDCGTAMIHGIGFGFANRVRPGSIGLVGAAGTGLQAISSQIHKLGHGVSHALGTGGRDLKSNVGGVTALQSLETLDRDPSTEVIVIVSKPPDPEVAAHLLSTALGASKPVVIQFMGYAPPARRIENLHFAINFHDAAAIAVGLLEEEQGSKRAPASPQPSERKFIRGLFSGGSLANEMLRVLQVRHAPVYSNISEIESYQLQDPLQPIEHTLLDLGEDIFTVGRLHPMIDNDLRVRMIRQEAANPEVGMILLDVVLGEGAHHDPARDLAHPISEAIKEHGVEVVVILVGTNEDPQDLEAQREKLLQSGAHVFEDALSAALFVGQRIPSSGPTGEASYSIEPLSAPVAAINLGLEAFFESLIDQGAKSVHVDWRPPAGGNEKLMSILKKMKE